RDARGASVDRPPCLCGAGAAARLSCRGCQRHRRRPAAQPSEECNCRMKHIGILGHSFEGATLCFRTACLDGVKHLGPHMHPEVTMTCSPMGLVLEAWERGDNQKLRAFFMEDARKLAAAGCDFFVCPDNTAHIALESQGEPF